MQRGTKGQGRRVTSQDKVTAKQYSCIVADPPWSYGGTLRHKLGRGAAINHYTDMPVEEICGLSIPAAHDAHLYLWVTNNHLLDGDGVAVCRAWGFVPKQLLTWVKPSIGLGR